MYSDNTKFSAEISSLTDTLSLSIKNGSSDASLLSRTERCVERIMSDWTFPIGKKELTFLNLAVVYTQHSGKIPQSVKYCRFLIHCLENMRVPFSTLLHANSLLLEILVHEPDESETQAAVELALQLFAQYTTMDDFERIGNTAVQLSVLLFNQRKYEQALEFMENAEIAFSHIDNYRKKSEAIRRKADILLAMGDYVRAIQCHEDTLRLAGENEDIEGELLSLGSLAQDAFRIGNIKSALSYHEAAVSKHEFVSLNRYDKALAKISYAQTLCYAFLYEPAGEILKSLYEEVKNSYNTPLIAAFHLAYAEYMWIEGRKYRSLAHLGMAIRAYRNTPNLIGLYGAKLNLAIAKLMSGDLPGALESAVTIKNEIAMLGIRGLDATLSALDAQISWYREPFTVLSLIAWDRAAKRYAETGAKKDELLAKIECELIRVYLDTVEPNFMHTVDEEIQNAMDCGNSQAIIALLQLKALKLKKMSHIEDAIRIIDMGAELLKLCKYPIMVARFKNLRCELYLQRCRQIFVLHNASQCICANHKIIEEDIDFITKVAKKYRFHRLAMAARLHRLDFYTLTGKKDKALKLFETLVSKPTKRILTRIRILEYGARLMLTLGKFELAEEYFLKAKEGYQTSICIGQYKDAIDDYELLQDYWQKHYQK